MARPFRTQVEVIRRRLDWRFVILIIGLLLLVHAYIFRDLLAAAPAMADNQASIVREELVPFFDFTTQYVPENNSALTGSDEFRVAYSYWTSWTRYNAILPFALVLVNSLAAFLLFYAFYRVVRYFVDATDLRRAAIIGLLGALVIHIVLLYSKVAHYYTLILGFSMFALAISLAVEQFFFKTRIAWMPVLAAAVLILLNPAIHYHVIAYLTMGLMWLLQAVFVIATKRPQRWLIIRRNLLFVVVVAVISLLPYLVYLRLVLPSTGSALAQAPVDYWSIYFSSVPLTYLFALDGLGHVDLYRHGNYLAPTPRIMTLFVFASIALVFLNKAWQGFEEKRKSFLVVLFMVILVALWMSIGYGNKGLYSFHQFLGLVSSLVADSTNSAALMVQKITGLFINVLRYPHRFELVLYYAAGVMICIGLVQISDILRKHKVHAGLAGLLIGIIALGPFMISGDYRQTLLSGNFGGFLEPYRPPQDLQAIKQVLSETKDNRIFIMPSLESGREIAGNSTNYRFLDKYFIYYLNQPSVYYGGGASNESKIVSFMVYRAIASGQDWWQDILIDDLAMTHIVVPHKLVGRDNGTVYMPDFDDKLAQSLQKSDRFKLVAGGDDYSLYQATERRQNDKAVLADFSWSQFASRIRGRQLDDYALYLPVQLQSFLGSQSEKRLATDNPERSFYRLYTTSRKTSWLPNASQLPFSSELIASSSFTANMFSMSKLYDKKDSYNYTREVLPSLAGLSSGQFVGLTAGSHESITAKLGAPDSGKYRVVAYAASKAPEITARIAGNQYKLRRIVPPPKEDNIDFEYYVADIMLAAGQNQIRINPSELTQLVEHIGIVAYQDLPSDFATVDLPGLSISPDATQGIYRIQLTGNQSK